MASCRGPTRARDVDYSNVGKTGRRTGVFLPQGRIDEHGMEEIGDMFSSSPRRKPASVHSPSPAPRRNGKAVDRPNGHLSESQKANASLNRRNEAEDSLDLFDQESDAGDADAVGLSSPTPAPTVTHSLDDGDDEDGDGYDEDDHDDDNANANKLLHHNATNTERSEKTTRSLYSRLSPPRQQDEQLPHPDLHNVIDKFVKEGRNPRNLYVLKREKPSHNDAQRTRSGRLSVKPLAYWRNERCVYGSGDVDTGQRFPLSTITEIVRNGDDSSDTDLTSQRRSKKKTHTIKSKRSRDDDADGLSGDETAQYAQPWETTGGGVMYGSLKNWDFERDAVSLDEDVTDIAWAPSAIQTNDVKNATFRFAKIMSSPLMSAGFVDLPAGGTKKQKNTKTMHLLFFVYYGRINVDISGKKFGIGKGGVFQVPRGVNYSLLNTRDKPASLFFTQGHITPDPPKGESSFSTQMEESQVTSAPATNANKKRRKKA